MPNDKQLTGNAGVYHVARELSRHGWNVMLTVRNARGADLFAVSASEEICHPIQVKSHGPKPQDLSLGLQPDGLVTPWWVFVSDAANSDKQPTCYVLGLEEVLKLRTRDPGTRTGKPESERLCWLDRRFYTPGSDRELHDAREAWGKLGDPRQP